MADSKLVQKVKYPSLHKLFAGVSLLSLVVTFMGGLMAGARFSTITFRALVVMIVVALISRIVMRVIASYEEMSGGKT